jgi:DNA-directed RNA polymerase subunit H (RpoH/RPB5)
MSAQSAKYNPLISKLFISRKVILKILKEHRNYNTENYEGMGIHELQEMFKNKQMDMLLTEPDLTPQEIANAEAKNEAELKTIELSFEIAREGLMEQNAVEKKIKIVFDNANKELEETKLAMLTEKEGGEEQRLLESEYSKKLTAVKVAQHKLDVSSKLSKNAEKRLALMVEKKREANKASEAKNYDSDGDISPQILESGSSKKIYIKYHLEGKLKQSHIYEYIEDIYEVEQILSNTDELLIITKDKMNQITKDLLVNIHNNDKKVVNIYNLNDYLFNIMDHDMVPPHRILSDDEKKEIYTKYYITDDKQLPEISRFDPVALAIGACSGDLVEIIRSSPTAITTKYYRLCL